MYHDPLSELRAAQDRLADEEMADFQAGRKPVEGSISPMWTRYFDMLRQVAGDRALRFSSDPGSPALNQLPGYQENVQAAMPLSLQGMLPQSNQLGTPTLRKRR